MIPIPVIFILRSNKRQKQDAVVLVQWNRTEELLLVIRSRQCTAVLVHSVNFQLYEPIIYNLQYVCQTEKGVQPIKYSNVTGAQIYVIGTGLVSM